MSKLLRKIDLLYAAAAAAAPPAAQMRANFLDEGGKRDRDDYGSDYGSEEESENKEEVKRRRMESPWGFPADIEVTDEDFQNADFDTLLEGTDEGVVNSSRLQSLIPALNSAFSSDRDKEMLRKLTEIAEQVRNITAENHARKERIFEGAEDIEAGGDEFFYQDMQSRLKSWKEAAIRLMQAYDFLASNIQLARNQNPNFNRTQREALDAIKSNTGHGSESAERASRAAQGFHDFFVKKEQEVPEFRIGYHIDDIGGDGESYGTIAIFYQREAAEDFVKYVKLNREDSDGVLIQGRYYPHRFPKIAPYWIITSTKRFPPNVIIMPGVQDLAIFYKESFKKLYLKHNPQSAVSKEVSV